MVPLYVAYSCVLCTPFTCTHSQTIDKCHNTVLYCCQLLSRCYPLYLFIHDLILNFFNCFNVQKKTQFRTVIELPAEVTSITTGTISSTHTWTCSYLHINSPLCRKDQSDSSGAEELYFAPQNKCDVLHRVEGWFFNPQTWLCLFPAAPWSDSSRWLRTAVTINLFRTWEVPLNGCGSWFQSESRSKPGGRPQEAVDASPRWSPTGTRPKDEKVVFHSPSRGHQRTSSEPLDWSV